MAPSGHKRALAFLANAKDLVGLPLVAPAAAAGCGRRLDLARRPRNHPLGGGSFCSAETNAMRGITRECVRHAA